MRIVMARACVRLRGRLVFSIHAQLDRPSHLFFLLGREKRAERAFSPFYVYIYMYVIFFGGRGGEKKKVIPSESI